MTLFENELTLPFDTNTDTGKTRKLFIIESFGPRNLYASTVEDDTGLEVDWIGEVFFKQITIPTEDLNNSLKARGCVSELSEEQVSMIETVYNKMLTSSLENAFSFEDDKYFEYDGKKVYYLGNIEEFKDRLVMFLNQNNSRLETPFTERQLRHIGDAVLFNIPCKHTMNGEDEDHITLPCNFTVENEFTDCYVRALQINYRSVLSSDASLLAACIESNLKTEDISSVLSLSPEQIEKEKDALKKRLAQAKWTVDDLEIHN